MPPGFEGGRQVWEFRLEMRNMLFPGSPEGRHTLVPSFKEETEIASVGFAFHAAKGSCFTTTVSPQASWYHGKDVTTDDEM